MEQDKKRKLVMRRINLLTKLVAVHGRKCWYCGTPFQSFSEVELDHIVPSSRGGKDGMSNYAIACAFCNRAKGAHTLDEFLRWLRKPKKPVAELHERAKECEQHWRDWGPEIAQGLRKPSTRKWQRKPRLTAYDVRIVADPT